MILAPLSDEQTKLLEAVEADGITVFTLYDGLVRGACASATRLCAQMKANHGLGLFEGIALGQAAICAGLLSTIIKGGDRLSLRIDCDGPLGGLQVETGSDGGVRGRLLGDAIEFDSAPESLDLAPLIGPGMLTLTRSPASGAQPYVGQTALVHSRIAEDLSEYYLRSEQTPTAFAASMKHDSRGLVTGAGGLYLQAMPGADAEQLSFIEGVLASAPPPGAWIAEGKKRRDYLIRNFLFAEIDFLEEKPLSFSCACAKERFASFILDLEEGEREAAFASSPRGPDTIEVICHNCGSVYLIGRQELS